MIFEKFLVENDYVTILDDDGQVSIQMEQKDFTEIVNRFNPFVQKKQNSTQIFNGVNYSTLTLELKFYGEEFCINGRIKAPIDFSSTYFHDFELESIGVEIWDKIKNIK